MNVEEELVDNRGTTITVGCRVAYNLSGEIGLGTVESATPAIKDGWKYIRRATIKIGVEYPQKLAGHISVVKNPKNVMVIFENAVS